MKKKRKSIVRFEPGSKLPVVSYITAAVVLSSFFLMLTIISSGFSLSLGESSTTGDLNNDGVVNSADAYQIIKNASNGKLEGVKKKSADIDGNGKIDREDAMMILQYSSRTSDHLGIPAKGNTSIEAAKPASMTIGASANSGTNTAGEFTHQPVSVGADSYVKSGTSANTAFCTNENNIYATARVSSKWKSGGKTRYQIDVTVKNNSAGSAGAPALTLKLSGSASVNEKWSCNADSSENSVSVQPTTNGYIPSGGSIKCGFIVESPANIKIESIS